MEISRWRPNLPRRRGTVQSGPTPKGDYLELALSCFMEASHPTSAFPAKAGTQIHPGRLVGFTWAPAFAGETEEGAIQERKS
ncbi:hypothetical protein ASD79_02555 [Caulobacter sp. Root655]|nr:hypothetical protein ASD79_02555 [Caulobacter sp. Root655]